MIALLLHWACYSLSKRTVETMKHRPGSEYCLTMPVMNTQDSYLGSLGAHDSVDKEDDAYL